MNYGEEYTLSANESIENADVAIESIVLQVEKPKSYTKLNRKAIEALRMKLLNAKLVI